MSARTALVAALTVVFVALVALAFTRGSSDEDATDAATGTEGIAEDEPAGTTQEGGGDGGGSEAPTTPATTTPDATMPDATTPATTEPEAGAPGSSLDDPLPLDGLTPTEFQYRSGGVEWDGSVFGLVETAPRRADDGPGRCLLLLGTLTPTTTTAAVSNPFNGPSAGVIADGEYVDDAATACDAGPAEELGYGWRLEAYVTVGTTYGWYANIFLPGEDPAEPEAIVLAQRSVSEPIFFEPAVLSEIPGFDPTPTAPDVELVEVGEASRFEHRDGPNVWTGEIFGLVEAEFGRFSTTTDGRCLLALGTLTPTEAAGAVSERFSVPPVGLIVDGRYVSVTGASCDASSVEALGYRWRLDAEIPIGTPYPFYSHIVVPDASTELHALVVGLSTDAEALHVTPTVLDAVPAP